MPRIDQFLNLLIQHSGSDLHLSCGGPPQLRVHGHLQRVQFRDLTEADLNTLVSEIITPAQLARYQATHDLDFAYEIPGTARFRGNFFRQHRGPGAVFRIIPSRIPSADEIGLPDAIRRFTDLNKGLVLVTGPTGSGKSTTLAAMVDLINGTRPEHILTIEDPIEFVHQNKKALVNQREVGPHTESFAAALKAALREDPDVILVGEMRDRETIALALTAAETGHLVFGTLHTNSAHKTVDRIIDTFPGDLQQQVRAMLAESLRGVVAQQLLRTKGGKGRVAAHEIMVGTAAVSNLIREAKTYQIPSIIQTGKRDGMIQMDQSILALLMAGKVDGAEAYAKALDKSLFQQYAG
ncbi:MAG TPA: type IV pilus twitching motility protein PilT [Longimicrobium sp.]|jgi:twitching motility protein PilT|uniref:type IV pilus twitching motility protein PilT n=1 Tax=Longimicrobium sp. TaxID=2029185 RepID=UPI002EDB9000